MGRKLLTGVVLTGLILAACADQDDEDGGGGGGGPSGPFVAKDDTVVLNGVSTILIDVLANDGGFDPGLVTVVLDSLPDNGTATVEPDLKIRYESYTGLPGTDTFTYIVDDGSTSPQTASVFASLYSSATANAPMVFMPRTSILPKELAVIVNDNDTQSVAVANYYMQQRKIPAQNLIHLNFTPGGSTMTAATFAPLYTQATAAAGAEIQAYVLTWTTPFRVEGMSITSAFALGYDTAYYNSAGGCQPTQAVNYYNSSSVRPYTDHAIRPCMMLAGVSSNDVFDLIDRGIAADGTFPTGTGYMIRTTDTARSVRWPAMVSTESLWDNLPDGLDMIYIDNSSGGGSNTISSTNGILYYLTGLTTVADINTNTYLPGAVADHLTSYGGVLTGTGQMSIVRWLEAGVTASFGTVIEPCNYTTKFPNPVPLTSFYYRGQTVLEAYWKSVAWPGEGIFVGEPLARPWGHFDLQFDGTDLVLQTTSLDPSLTYKIEVSDSPGGVFVTALGGITIPHHQLTTITVPNASGNVYRLVEQ